MLFLHLSSKSTATVQKNTPAHNILGQASGELVPPTPTTPAHSVAWADGGGLPLQVGDNPSSKSTTPAPSFSTGDKTALHHPKDLTNHRLSPISPIVLARDLEILLNSLTNTAR